jgi:hypothetical protein
MKVSGVNDQVGKVFLVLRGGRRCLVCGGVFTPTEAAKHAQAPCNSSVDIPQGEVE